MRQVHTNWQARQAVNADAQTEDQTQDLSHACEARVMTSYTIRASMQQHTSQHICPFGQRKNELPQRPQTNKIFGAPLDSFGRIYNRTTEQKI